MVSNFECDDCNKFFKKYEDDAANMVQHYFAMLNIKTKKSVPVFQSFKEHYQYSTFLKTVNNGRNLDFGTNLSDFEIDKNENTLTVFFRTRKFRPFYVYKTFLKMAISLLSEEVLSDNSHYLEFLHSEVPIMNGMQPWTATRYLLKTKYHLVPKINLYRAKQTTIENEELPEFVLLIKFSNIIFPFFLPMSRVNMLTHKKTNKLRLEIFPAFVLEKIERLKAIELFTMELNETGKVSIADKVIFYYQHPEESPG